MDTEAKAPAKKPVHYKALAYVADRYKLVKKLKVGANNMIVIGYDLETRQNITCKIECRKFDPSRVLHEGEVYRHLKDGVGFPKLLWHGWEDGRNLLVIESVGPSLQGLLKCCESRFSEKTVLMLADQMISRIQFLHSKNFIHRDISPDNFLMGIHENGFRVYLIDFSLAKLYREPRTNQHIPCRDDKKPVGTPRYASITAQLGIEQSRRDDLQALGYVLVYFLRGSLPWQDQKAANGKQKYEKINEIKMSTPIELLCKGLSEEFVMYLKYCRELNFDDEPDYKYLRMLFRNLMKTRNYTWDFFYEWFEREKARKMKLKILEAQASSTSVEEMSGNGLEKECAPQTLDQTATKQYDS